MAKTKRPEGTSVIRKEVGKRLARVRTLCGVKQEDLAEAIGCSPSHVSHIEGGKSTPSIFYIIQVATRLKVTTDYLLRGILFPIVDEDLRILIAVEEPDGLEALRSKVSSTGKVQA